MSTARDTGGDLMPAGDLLAAWLSRGLDFEGGSTPTGVHGGEADRLDEAARPGRNGAGAHGASGRRLVICLKTIAGAVSATTRTDA
jgi:hypothetical protein